MINRNGILYYFILCGPTNNQPPTTNHQMTHVCLPITQRMEVFLFLFFWCQNVFMDGQALLGKYIPLFHIIFLLLYFVLLLRSVRTLYYLPTGSSITTMTHDYSSTAVARAGACSSVVVAVVAVVLLVVVVVIKKDLDD